MFPVVPTRDPPHEQLLVRLGRVAWSLGRCRLVAPAIHPTSNLLAAVIVGAVDVVVVPVVPVSSFSSSSSSSLSSVATPQAVAHGSGGGARGRPHLVIFALGPRLLGHHQLALG